MNTKEEESLDEIKKINDLGTFIKYVKETQKIIREKEEKMSVQQVIDMHRKIAKKASTEWKYEFRKQINLLKKRVEIGI